MDPWESLGDTRAHRFKDHWSARPWASAAGVLADLVSLLSPSFLCTHGKNVMVNLTGLRITLGTSGCAYEDISREAYLKKDNPPCGRGCGRGLTKEEAG